MNFVILDLEWNPSYSKKLKGFINEIIEFGAIKVNSDLEIIDTFSALVRPQIGKKLNEKITTLTHITDEDVEDGCTYTHALSGFRKFLGDSVLMTWGITDIYVLMENTKYFLQDDRLSFIDNYTNLQDYCEDMLIQKNIKNNEKSAGKQMGLTTATELLEISLDNISHHRALDDSIIAYECFKNLYSYPILLSHIQKFNDEFYRKLTFKNTILCDLNNPLIDKKEMYFTCPCGYRAKRKKPWKFSCKSFIAPFACKHCGNTFMGRIQFKLKYDGVHIIKKIFKPINTENTDTQKVTAGK